MNIKKRFEELKRKEQIQLCGIVFMCYILIFVFYEDISDKLFPKTLESTQKIFHKPVKTQDKRLSNLELYQYLNKIVKKYNIDLIETQIAQNNIKIDIRGKFDDLISFMNKYEQNFVIESYEMEPIDKSMMALSLSINIEKFYESSNMKKKDIKATNPYFNEGQEISQNKKSSPLRTETVNKKDREVIITAIIGSEILIRDQWYEIDDIYEHHKVKEIGKRSVIFINTKTDKETIRRITNE